jgi:hypothetical protein
MKAEQQRVAQNLGRMHTVKCEWCKLKMACSCYFDEIREKPDDPHPLVMCPRCQVTEFLNLLFGGSRPEKHQSSSNGSS